MRWDLPKKVAVQVIFMDEGQVIEQIHQANSLEILSQSVYSYF